MFNWEVTGYKTNQKPKTNLLKKKKKKPKTKNKYLGK